MLYGASDARIGKAFDDQLSPNKAKAKGTEIRAAYVEAIPGLDKLLSAVELASERGYVQAIDGRRVLVDSGHKALNYLLQGTAAVLAKRWMVIAHQNIKQLGIEAHQLAFVHDELQFETYHLMLMTYAHPWYSQQQKLASSTSSECGSTQKPKAVKAGPRLTDPNRCGDFYEHLVVAEAMKRGAIVYIRTSAVLVTQTLSLKKMPKKFPSMLSRLGVKQASAPGVFLVVVDDIDDSVRWGNKRRPKGWEDFLVMSLLIDADYIVYKCTAAAEEDFDFGDDVILVTSRFSDAMRLVDQDLGNIANDLGVFDDSILFFSSSRNFRKDIAPDYKDTVNERNPVVIDA